MTGIHLVAILSVATLAVVAHGVSLLEAEIPTKCPAVDSINKTISLAHETDCTKFYTCAAGHKIENICPFMNKNGNRLHFNPVLQICDWPQSASCRSGNTPATAKSSGTATTTVITTTATKSSTTATRTSTTTVTPTTTSETITTTPVYCPKDTKGITLKLIDESLCDHFYLCTDGEINLVRCPRGTFFDTVLRICDYPENVDCDHRRTTVEMNPTVPTVAKPRKNWNACPPKGSSLKVLLPHECQCGNYYECLDGDALLRQCPKDLHYDNVRQVCDLQHRVKCVRPIPVDRNKRSTEEEEESNTPFAVKTINNNSNTCPPEGSTEKRTLPHEYNCDRYYHCVDGKKILKVCSAGLHYDHKRGLCDRSELVKRVRPAPASVEATGPSAKRIKITRMLYRTAVCIGKADGTRLPHEYNCTLYYVCKNGQKFLGECGRGTHFNPRLSVCDFPENARCENGPTEPPVPTEPTEKSTPRSVSECRPGEIYRFAHETDCNLYYLCYYGEKILYSCPQNLRFNRNLLICDWPENVSCYSDSDSAGTGKTMIETPATCIGTCPIKDPFDHTVLLPNDDCKKFCMCSHGVGYIHDCPADLRFDSVNKVCDNPTSAVCGVRPSGQSAFMIDRKDDEDEENDSLGTLNEEIDDARETRDNF